MPRTLSSAKSFSAEGSRDRKVPRNAPRNPSGMLTIAGFFSGNHASFMKSGLTRMSTMLETSPTSKPLTAPVVVKRFQKIEKTMTGRFALAATAKASPTRNATLTDGPSRIAIPIAAAPTTNAVIRATFTSSPGRCSFP